MRNESLISSSSLSLEESYLHAEAVTRSYARTFYFASALLSETQRKHAYAIYAFCRTADSLVDDALKGEAPEEIRLHLTELRRFVRDPLSFLPDYPWAAAFRETVQSLSIPAPLFEELLNGVEMDLSKSRYATFEELYLYCYRVAGVVGQMMCYVYGLTDEESFRYAEKLGVAMQLTNILRDVKEDWQRGRLYIPQEELLSFGVSEPEVGAGQATPAYETLMRYQIARARSYYREAAPGIARIPSLPVRLTTLAMARLYEGILDKLEENPFQNLFSRAALSRIEKYLLTAQTFLGLTPVGSRPLPGLYRLAVGFLLFTTPFALIDTLTGTFSKLAGVSDSMYLVLWSGTAAYALAARQSSVWAAWGLSVLLGYVIEFIGIQTGYPFGPYAYTDVLRPQLLGVPLAIAMAWGSLVGLWASLWSGGRLMRALWVAMGATAVDLLLEPYATAIRHYWHWDASEIPLANYASWGIFAALLSLLYPARPLRGNPYPDVARNLGRALLLLLSILLLVTNLVHGQAVLTSLIASGVIISMLLWRRI